MINQTSFNLTDLPKKTYNGWADWTSWNCALWVGGDEGLYNLAKDCDSWFDFIICMQDMGTVSYTHLTLPTNREV